MVVVYMTLRVISLDDRLDNNQIYVIRREIARSLENSEFGNVVELEDNKFGNTFIIPTNDEATEESLELSYTFALPLRHGRLSFFLFQEFPRLKHFIRTLENRCEIQMSTNFA